MIKLTFNQCIKQQLELFCFKQNMITNVFSLLTIGRKLLAWVGIVVINNFSSLFSSETTAPIFFIFGVELPWVEGYHVSSLHVCRSKNAGYFEFSNFL